MFYDVRKNETLLIRIIFQYNKRFSFLSIYNWKCFNENNYLTIEGGDIAYLGSNILLIGLSERTNKHAIQTLFKTNLFENIFVVKLPPRRVYMHLDMILSQVSQNIFTFHQPLKQKIEIFHLQQVLEFIFHIL
jgi:arginine deiminase